jgi:secreted PhoX family phosphatase
MKRRTFLDFILKGTAVSLLPLNLVSCSEEERKALIYKALDPQTADLFQVMEGLEFSLLIKQGDKISDTDHFGSHNDYTAMVPKPDGSGYILWVNHEYLNPLFIHGENLGTSKTEDDVVKEMYEVGGSLLDLNRDANGNWSLVQDSIYNRRLHGGTMIPFSNKTEILGQSVAMGTLANCAGGKTPWGTILTCEENYDSFYGERDTQTGERIASFDYGWENYFDNPPEHYGWVVEVNPLTGEARKHTSMGRCSHECATVTQLEDGRCVVYTGDDANDEHLYKMISSNPNDLSEGKLYVANLEKGEWISLDINDHDILKANFENQLEIQIRLREAAKLVGATPLARPEDIEIDPLTGHVYIALTNNKPKGDYLGSIMKIMEQGDDHSSKSFTHETFLAGGLETGFACPDNLVFDHKGNLWFTTDISGSAISKGPYEGLGNNALFVVLRSGERSGEILRVATAPVDAELTGVSFAPDSNELFVCVQHPGSSSSSLTDLSSSWPGESGDIPKSAVVVINGPFMDDLLG